MPEAASPLSASLQTKNGVSIAGIPAAPESTPSNVEGSSSPLSSNGDDDDDNASESDSEKDGVKRWVINPAPKPRKITEKRRADTAAFELWLEQNQHALSKTVKKLAFNDDQSAAALVRDFESKKIITSPRDYQLELFERAKAQNTIAVLDTGMIGLPPCVTFGLTLTLGSGKTLIAALLLRWVIQNEVEDRAKGCPPRISFFLVDKVALVFQQHAVLSCNLDYPIEKLCGEMIEGVESKQFWDKVFKDNMAVVCTADILYGCLAHSWIRMDQINLLIFDEAHHTKKNHPYARIIKDFYAKAEDDNEDMDVDRTKDKQKRPRILGMTASPVDAKISPEKAAAELEGLLHSQIATAADPTALQHTICKPKREMIVEYGRRLAGCETELTQSLRSLVGHHYLFRRAFIFAAVAASDLGFWCTDRFWELFFAQSDMTSMESKTERDDRLDKNSTQPRGTSISQFREARRLVESHAFLPPALVKPTLSEKVIQLANTLREQNQDPDSNRRCIVFVKQRHTAMALVDLFQQPEIRIPGVKVGALVRRSCRQLLSDIC